MQSEDELRLCYVLKNRQDCKRVWARQAGLLQTPLLLCLLPVTLSLPPSEDDLVLSQFSYTHKKTTTCRTHALMTGNGACSTLSTCSKQLLAEYCLNWYGQSKVQLFKASHLSIWLPTPAGFLSSFASSPCDVDSHHRAVSIKHIRLPEPLPLSWLYKYPPQEATVHSEQTLAQPHTTAMTAEQWAHPIKCVLTRPCISPSHLHLRSLSCAASSCSNPLAANRGRGSYIGADIAT